MNLDSITTGETALTWRREPTLPETAVGMWITSLASRGNFSDHANKHHPELIESFTRYLTSIDIPPYLTLKENAGGVSVRAEFRNPISIERQYPLPFATAITVMQQLSHHRRGAHGGFRNKPNFLFTQERELVAQYMSEVDPWLATATYPLFGKILKTGLIIDAVRRVNGIQATTDAAKDLADLTDRLIMYYRGARMYVTPTNVAFKPSKYPPPNVLLNFEDSYIPATASGKFIVILPVKYSNGDKNCLQFLPYIETVYHQVSPENITWQ